MKIHNFSQPTSYSSSTFAKPAFELHGVTLDTFRGIRGGEFCALPEGHASCLPGFRPYRCADGTVVGVENLS
jgi:hypothetical protein